MNKNQILLPKIYGYTIDTMTSECTTKIGKFRIKTSDSNIYVGGITYCVNIKINTDTADLFWLETAKGGCELSNKKISGDDTIYMVDLAFSILRDKYPHISTVNLLDDSGFTWRDSRGRPYKVNFLKGYVLLHQKTWYEDKFGATINNDSIYKIYKEKINNFTDPSKKPDKFNFMNPDTQALLEPLYNKTDTWKEFIDLFIKEHNDNKYKLMFDWYRNAIYTIMNGYEINQDWKIVLSARPYISCIDTKQIGGLKSKINTRKKHNFTFSRYNTLEPYYHNAYEVYSK